MGSTPAALQMLAGYTIVDHLKKITDIIEFQIPFNLHEFLTDSYLHKHFKNPEYGFRHEDFSKDQSELEKILKKRKWMTRSKMTGYQYYAIHKHPNLLKVFESVFGNSEQPRYHVNIKFYHVFFKSNNNGFSSEMCFECFKKLNKTYVKHIRTQENHFLCDLKYLCLTVFNNKTYYCNKCVLTPLYVFDIHPQCEENDDNLCERGVYFKSLFMAFH